MRIAQFFKSNPVSSIILVLDIAGLVLCFELAHYARVGYLVTSMPALALLMITTLTCLYLFNTYSIEAPNKALRIVSRCVIALLVATVVAVLIGFIIGRNAFVPLFGRTVLIFAFIIFTIWAALIRYLISRFSWKQAKNRWLYVGEAEKAALFARDFGKHDHSGSLKCLLEVDDGQVESGYIAGTFEEYSGIIRNHWDGIIIDSLNTLPEEIASDLLQRRLAGTKVYTLTEFYSRQWSKVPIFHVGQQWLMDVDGFVLLEDSVNHKLKLIFDMLLSVVLSVLTLPLIIIFAAAVRLSSKGPAIYRQSRVGLHGKPFRLYKFRTMYMDAESSGPQWTSVNDPRITWLGNILRQTRLDELPQIFNVLKSEMSFIGPRPERPEFVSELEREIPYYDMRHLVKPGITGWAQVMYDYGASNEDAKEKLQYDLFYIKNHSILLDSIIILKTLKTVLSARGR